MQQINFKIEGMTCEACAKLVTRYLKKISGVESVEASVTGEGRIISSRELSKEELQSALTGTHYNIIL